MPETLDGPRVRLVRHTIDLAPADAEAIAESLDELAPWQPWVAKFEGLASCQDYARWVARQWGLRWDYQVIDREDGRFLGHANLEDWKPDVPSASIGYWLRTSATGMGYATEAASLLAQTAFDCLGLVRLELFCDARNSRSAAVARRLGMDLEGVLRKDRRDAQGALQDTMVWSRVR